MKLLSDQNLSRHLVRQIAEEYPESRHMTDVGLDTATDTEIWSYAGDRGFVIVSKDSDFRQLAFLNGPPPKSVWLQLGNASTAEVITSLRNSQSLVVRIACQSPFQRRSRCSTR